MFISSKNNPIGMLLAAAMMFGSMACTSSSDNEVAEQVGEDYEYVYVDENGNQVDPKSVNSEEYEVVDGEDVPASAEVADMGDSISDAEDAVTSDSAVSEEDATDDELKEMLANINEGEDSLGAAPTPGDSGRRTPIATYPTASESVAATEADSDGYVSLDDESSASPAASEGSAGGMASSSNQSGEFYVVQAGDTLSQIAQRTTGSYRTWPKLAEQNSLSNPHLIFPGNKIFYSGVSTASAPTKGRSQGPLPKMITPDGPHVEVQAGDTLSELAMRVYGDANKWRELAERNKEAVPNPDVIWVGQKIGYNEQLATQKPAETTEPAAQTVESTPEQPTEETADQPMEQSPTEQTTDAPTENSDSTSH